MVSHLVQIVKHKIQHSEFDYTALTSSLSAYANQRNQISRLIRQGDIIRVKKGVYVFGPKVGAPPFSHAILAQLIYGPSYLSCETALSYYGLIPERVESTISMTTKRASHFKTPVGEFIYHHLHPAQYQVGMTQVEINPNRHVLMATPEKALIDLIARLPQFCSLDEVEIWTQKSLRIEKAAFFKLSTVRFKAVAQAYSKHGNVALLRQYRESLR